MVTLKHIAEKAGVSYAVVSDVVHNKWQQKGIAKETRDRVLKIVEQMDYRPNRIARSLVSKKTYMIGVKLPSLVYQYWTKIAIQLEQAAQRYNYHTFFSVPGDWQNESQEIMRLYEHQVDGLIISPRIPQKLSELYEWLDNKKLPFVFIGTKYTDKYYAALDDNIEQAKLAVNYLISLGHRKIAHICGSMSSITSIDRKKGYQQALTSAGIDISERYILRGKFNTDNAYQAMKRLLSTGDIPTAVYCANDLMAIGAIEAIEQFGLRVPEDISVVGHGDDIPFESFHRIPLTTIRQPVKQMTEIAMAMLIEIIEGKTPSQKTVMCQGELVIRKSCQANKS